MAAVERVPLHRPFTAREEQVVQLVAAGLSYPAVATQLGITVYTVHRYVEQATAKIPGSLPPRARIICWWRGASMETLG